MVPPAAAPKTQLSAQKRRKPESQKARYILLGSNTPFDKLQDCALGQAQDCALRQAQDQASRVRPVSPRPAAPNGGDRGRQTPLNSRSSSDIRGAAARLPEGRTFELPVELPCFGAIRWEVRLQPLNMRIFGATAIGVTLISDSKAELPELSSFFSTSLKAAARRPLSANSRRLGPGPGSAT